MDILQDLHTPRLARSDSAAHIKMVKKYLLVLLSHVNQTAEEVYPASACATDLKSIFHFLIFLVSETGEIRLLGH